MPDWPCLWQPEKITSLKQPETPNHHRAGRTEAHQPAVHSLAPNRKPRRQPSQRPGKTCHGNNRASREHPEVCQRLKLTRKEQDWQYSQKMGTAGQPMKDSDAESGVCVMLVRVGLFVGYFRSVRMQMDVAIAVVLVFVCVNSKSLS
jgi:hypothetical protein